MDTKRSGKVFLIFAICAFIAAAAMIVLLIRSINIHVPPMGSEGWFRASSNKARGIGLSIFGSVSLSIFGSVFLFLYYNPIKKRLQSAAQTVSSIFSPPQKQPQFCEYCGTQLEDGTVFCKACGGGKKKQK